VHDPLFPGGGLLRARASFCAPWTLKPWPATFRTASGCCGSLFPHNPEAVERRSQLRHERDDRHEYAICLSEFLAADSRSRGFEHSAPPRGSKSYTTPRRRFRISDRALLVIASSKDAVLESHSSRRSISLARATLGDLRGESYRVAPRRREESCGSLRLRFCSSEAVGAPPTSSDRRFRLWLPVSSSRRLRARQEQKRLVPKRSCASFCIRSLFVLRLVLCLLLVTQ